MIKINNYIKMISFNDYIIEKLKISKNTKALDDTDDYLIIYAWGSLYTKLCKIYGDAVIDAPGEPFIFILPKKDALKYKEKYPEECSLYKIPDGYSTLSDFEEDYTDGKISIEDEEEYKEED